MQSRIPGPSARAAAVSDTRSLTAMNRPAQTFGSLNKHSLLQCKSGSQKDLSDGLSQLPVMNGNIHLGSTTRHQHVSSVSQTRNPLPNKKQPTEKSSKQTPRQFNPSASPSLNDCQKALASGNEKGLSNANGVVEEFKYQSKFSKNARHHRPEISPSNREQDSSSEFAEVELCITETNGGGSTYSSPQMLHKQTRALSKTHQSMKKTSSRLPEGSQKEEKRASERISSTAKALSAKNSRIADLSHTRNRVCNEMQKGVSTLPPRGKCKSRFSLSNDNLLHLSSSGYTADSEKPRSCSNQRQWKSDVNWKSYSFSNLLLDESENLSELSLSSTSSPKHRFSSGVKMSVSSNVIKLPSPTQNSHPNTATVAPFMYRADTKRDGNNKAPKESAGHCSTLDSVGCNWKSKTSLEDPDPETQRKRTVQNIVDLRQNLEDTMSSLRGSQITHSVLESTFESDISAELNGRGRGTSLSNRSSPLSWRYGQASPRLQAGDAPSVGSGCQSGGNSGWFVRGDTSHYSHTMPMRSSSKSCNIAHLDLDSLDTDDVDLKSISGDMSGYMSDSDLIGKTMNDDDITTGWDESSSVSSGLSDTSDNLSSEDLNASSSLNSYPSTPVASRRNSGIVLRTDAEKRSMVESGLTWYGGSEGKGQKKAESGYDASNVKMDQNTKWRRIRTEPADEISKEVKKPQTIGQIGSVKKSTAPVGITSPMTSSGASSLKVAAKTEAKAQDKNKLALKGSGLQRSSSDAGRERIGEARKPPSGISRPATAGSFGYKKPTTGTATVVTVGGNCGSTTKVQKSTGIPVKPNSRKTSLDVSQSQDGFMSAGARTNVQYRSLPRPAKSSSVTITGRGMGNRPVSSNIDPSLISSKHGGIPVSRLKEPSKIGMGRPSSGPVNQTDREKEKAKAKAVASDSECTTVSSSTKSISTAEGSSKLQGMRQQGSKLSEISSPTAHRVMSSKGIGKPPALANIDKINSNSLDSPVSATGSVTSSIGSDTFHKLSEAQTAVSGVTPCLTPSPAPVLNVNSGSFNQGLGMVSNFMRGKETLMYPKLSSLHTSMESLDLPLSVPCSFSGSSTLSRESREEIPSGLTWTGSSRFSQMESAHRDRNTLPKKGLRYGTSLQPEDTKEWFHARSIGAPVDAESQLLASPSTIPLSNLASPTAASQLNSPTPKIMRSNSIPTHDSSFDLYGSLQLGSTMSLVERPKGMIRSGSFRDPVDDVHGSVLSLASTTSSVHSASEDKIQTEHIRKLRRELESSHDKVSALTSQLSTNAHLVAAFEQSLTNMTSRLQNLAVTAEQKDTELVELKDTIDMLHKKNAEAQAVIQGALNTQDLTPKELRIKRQNSSDSISSLNSITSHSSIGSGKDADAKKKKKKSWLRSSFKQAFTLKKTPKSASSYSDIEEIATPDSSVPSSPKMQREDPESPSPSMKPSLSSSGVYNCNDPEKDVSNLRSELWEKERKLTDIRLEALNSAHQLEHLREAMHNMQVEIEALKLENDRLKSETDNGTGSVLSTSSATSSPRRSLGLSLAHSFSLSLTDSVDTELTQMDGVTGFSQKEERNVRIVVLLTEEQICNETTKQQEFFIGSIKINGTTDWMMLDGVICQLFKDYITKVDPVSCLGLSTDAIYSYSVGHVKRVFGTDAPDLLPYRYLSKDVTYFSITLKGLKEKSVDSLVFESLIPKPMMQHYISLLLKHRRLILSGPSGTGKSYLSIRLAEYLVQRSGREINDGIIVTFNMDTHSCKDLQLYLSNLANQIDRETSTGNVPLIIILDDLSDAGPLSELVNGALTCKYHKCPYIMGTTNQPVKTTPNHGLHLSFRLVPFSNNAEPANGFLNRYLQRKLIESENDANANNSELLDVLNWVPKLWYHLHTFLDMHSTSDFLIGPCFFLSSPVNVAEFREWFIDLWNYSILPYLQEGVKDGIKTYGKKAMWEDPSKWVKDTLPWSTALQDRSKIFHLPPQNTGSQVTGPPTDTRKVKETAPSSLESDPLMTMLLRLQEAANYTQSCEGDNILDSSLQSTL